MKFLDLNGLTSVLSKLLTKVSTAFDGLEERVTANETAIEGKADEEHSHEDVNELIKRLYVNNYDGSESQLNMIVALSGGLSETVNVGDDANVYICNNGDAYLAGSGETYDYSSSTALFINNESIENIYILNGITSIGSSAFRQCASLTSITISDSVTSIGSSTFYGCTALTSITIPDSVTSIGSTAFYNCTSLTTITIPSSVTSIGSNAFWGCTGLTSITIPSSVTSIGANVFRNCTALTTITINKPQDSITGQPWGAAGAEVIWTGGE